jgi:hypothetical protein
MIDAHYPEQNVASAPRAIGRAIYSLPEGAEFVIEFITIDELVRRADEATALMWPNVPTFETMEIEFPSGL